MKWTDEQRKEFYELMMMLAENYGRDFSQALVKGWFEAFQSMDIPFEHVKEAVIKHMTTHRDFPKLADIINAIRGAGTWQDIEALAEKAYREAVKAASQVGAYQSVRFRDPIINAVISDLGGWEKLCMMPVDGAEAAIYRQEFIKLYIHYFRKGKVRRVDYLPGIFEAENKGKYKLPPVIELGEPRNQRIGIYEDENVVALPADREVEPLRPLRPRKPKELADGGEPVSPEQAAKYKAMAKLLLKKIAKPLEGR